MDNSEPGSGKRTLIYTILATLLLGSSSPWWWNKVFPDTQQPTNVVSDSSAGDAVKPAPSSKSERKEKDFTVEALGIWGNSVRGDNDMDTDDNDVVPVRCITELYYTNTRVGLKVTFYTREDGGDHTTFDGSRDFTVYNESSGKKITDLKVNGNYSVEFNAESVGQNHSSNVSKILLLPIETICIIALMEMVQMTIR